MTNRCVLHGQERCPLCASEQPASSSRRPRASQFNMAIGKDGNPLPYSSDEVTDVATKALDEGELIAILIKLPSGDLAFQVMGPPSRELVEMLRSATTQYERALGFIESPPTTN